MRFSEEPCENCGQSFEVERGCICRFTEKGKRPMKEWNVRIDGKWIGTVFARNEEVARLAAISRFEPSFMAEISVNPR